MSRIYFGRLGGDGGSVAVHTPDGVLELAAHATAGGGSRPGGPVTVAMARALLGDLLGAPVTDGLAVTFAGDVFARLPAGDFVLGEGAIRDWLAGRRPARMTGGELVEHLGRIAVADEVEESGALARLLDRCWGPQALAN